MTDKGYGLGYSAMLEAEKKLTEKEKEILIVSKRRHHETLTKLSKL